MRPTEPLRRALEDPAVAQRLDVAADAAARWIDNHPALAAVRAALRGTPARSATVERRLRPLLADAGWARQLLAELVALVRGEPLLELPMIPTQAGRERAAVLASSPAATVSLVLRGDGADVGPVRVGGRLVLHHVLSGRVEVQSWRGAAMHDDFSMETAPVLRPDRWRTVEPSGLVREEGRRNALRFRADRPAVLLRATIHVGGSPFARVHDEDGRLVGASATNEGASRLAMLATMLAAMNRQDAVPAIERLLEAEDFSLRWLAARLLIDLDADAGRRALLRLAEDPHPEVSAAARAALSPMRRAA